MTGVWLALGVTGALAAAAGLAQRGSRARYSLSEDPYAALRPTLEADWRRTPWRRELDPLCEVLIDQEGGATPVPRWLFHADSAAPDPFVHGFAAKPVPRVGHRGGEAAAIRELFGNPEQLSVVWLATNPDSPYRRSGYVIDALMLDPRQMRLTGQAEGHLVYAGDVPPEAVVAPPPKRHNEAWPPSGLLPYSTRRVVFHPLLGLGNTGTNRNIDYLGFTAWMYPGQFLDLVPPPIDDPERMVPLVRAAVPIAPLMLDLRLVEEGLPAVFRVRTFEGRHRAAAAHKLGRSERIPVHVIVQPPYERARYLAPEMLEGAVVHSDPRRTRPGRPEWPSAPATSHTIDVFTLVPPEDPSYDAHPHWKRGSMNPVASSGYDRTAIASTGASAPLRHLIAHHAGWVKGRVLDFGSGRGRDCAALGRRRGVKAACYDPHHPKAAVRKLPSGAFDLVLATYVVNVLPKTERKAAVKQMASKVARGGRLVVTARGKGDADGEATAASWKRHSDGHAIMGSDGTPDRFQKFYTTSSLASEIGRWLPSSFEREELSVPGSDTAMVAYRRKR